MSIGEAETYRYYWWSHWRVLPPAWLGTENKDWKDHFPVRFWKPAWQRRIFEPQPSALQRLTEFHLRWTKPYLDRIIDAGYDGVYLDRVDVFENWANERPTAEAEMVAFVREISAYAKARRPGFLVVPQNAEDLLRLPEYRKAIDAVAKESLLFGLEGDEKRNSEADVMSVVALLTEAQSDHIPVLVVEYLAEPEKRFEALQRLSELGFLPLFAGRQLNAIPEVVPAFGAVKANGGAKAPMPPAPVPAKRPQP